MQASVLVNGDGTLANSAIHDNRLNLFRDGEKHFVTEYDYRNNLAELEYRMDKFLCSYDS